MKKAVLLNDTSYENHHGCTIVMENIQKNLQQRNIELIAINPIGKDWKKNPLFMKALSECDIVLVNAEGTIHHDSPYALSLLKIVEYTKKPTVLMNMTYQENSQQFANLVQCFTKIYVRESMSQAELTKFGINSKVVPDMTFASSYEIAKERNHEICITDSHDIKISERLYRAAANQQFLFLPILAPYAKYSSIKGLFKKIKYAFIMKFGKLFNKFFSLRYSYLRYLHVLPKKKFIEKVADCDLLVTARFHALCIAIQTMTPFLIFKSNTHKIEGLLQDVHLTQERIVDIALLEKIDKDTIVNEKKFAFSEAEKSKIQQYLMHAKDSISHMFDEIAML